MGGFAQESSHPPQVVLQHRVRRDPTTVPVKLQQRQTLEHEHRQAGHQRVRQRVLATTLGRASFTRSKHVCTKPERPGALRHLRILRKLRGFASMPALLAIPIMP